MWNRDSGRLRKKQTTIDIRLHSSQSDSGSNFNYDNVDSELFSTHEQDSPSQKERGWINSKSSYSDASCSECFSESEEELGNYWEHFAQGTTGLRNYLDDDGCSTCSEHFAEWHRVFGLPLTTGIDEPDSPTDSTTDPSAV